MSAAVGHEIRQRVRIAAYRAGSETPCFAVMDELSGGVGNGDRRGRRLRIGQPGQFPLCPAPVGGFQRAPKASTGDNSVAPDRTPAIRLVAMLTGAFRRVTAIKNDVAHLRGSISPARPFVPDFWHTALGPLVIHYFSVVCSAVSSLLYTAPERLRPVFQQHTGAASCQSHSRRPILVRGWYTEAARAP